MGAGLRICEQQAEPGSPNVKSSKYFSFLPVALDRGGVKCWHTWFEFWRCSLAGPFPPAGSLHMVQLPQLWTCLQQRWRSKLSTSSKSVKRWGKKQAQSLQRAFGPTYADVSMSRGPAWPEGYIFSGAVCGNVKHVSKYWAVVLCTVNGTLVQQLLPLCLKICHPSPVILSDPRDPFNFVSIECFTFLELLIGKVNSSVI